MIILGIESSCDDTSIALIEKKEKGFDILNIQTISQIDVHRAFGGVVPEIAGRKHAEAIAPLLEQTLKERRPDLIAVTAGPGLITGLLVGVEAAKTLSFLWNIPMVGVNHISGHVHAVCDDQDIAFPALCLVVSGGHTELLLMKSHTDFDLLGKTRDDAAGETFDKIAKMLALPYPGGPQISRLAANGTPDAIVFPRPMMREKDGLDMSFAGLKTAVRYWLNEHPIEGNKQQLADVCASAEQAIVDVLAKKTLKAIRKTDPKSVIIAGGVSANKKLRDLLATHVTDRTLLLAPPHLTMDNGAMIAMAGYYLHEAVGPTNWQEISADPNWRVYDI